MSPASKPVALAAAVAAVAAACGMALALASGGGERSRGVLLAERFDGPDRLLANERSRVGGPGPRSARWRVTSGSLFVRDGRGWTGVPDGDSPGCCSRRATGSAVFRVVSRRADLGDVEVGFTLRALRLVSTRRTPPRAYDGVHVLLRYRSERELYAASVGRRDGSVVIRKKLPGGPANGGRYVDVGPRVTLPLALGADRRIAVRVRDVAGAGTAIRVLVDGRSVLLVTDAGAGGPPLSGSGRAGLRADNTELTIDDLVVRALR